MPPALWRGWTCLSDDTALESSPPLSGELVPAFQATDVFPSCRVLVLVFGPLLIISDWLYMCSWLLFLLMRLALCPSPFHHPKLIAFASFVRLHATTIRRTCRRLLLIYIHILHARPLVSRAISAGVIFLSADFLAQRLSSSTTPFDYVRLLRYSSYGLIVMGPFLYLWYSVMHLYGPDDTLIGAAQKALFEQITLEPLCIGGYMVWDGAMRRRPMGEVRARLRAQFWGLLLKNAVFWVPANFSNYAAGTPDLRVLYANLCSLFWNVYFSSFVNSLPDTVAGAGSSTGGLGKGRRPPSPPQDESCGV